jgi:hypothetical protein
LRWEDFSRPEVEAPRDGHTCSAGQTHLYIDADGKAWPCRRRVGCRSTAPDARRGIQQALAQLGCDPCRACTEPDLTDLNHLHDLDVPTVLGWVFTHAR